ncbi:MAG: ATP-binding protein [Pseudomonadota bacterium]
MLLALVLASLFWVSNSVLTERYTLQLAERAVVRSALQAGRIAEALRGATVTVSLMARDATLVAALSGDSSRLAALPEHLVALQRETRLRALQVLDGEGVQRAAAPPATPPLAPELAAAARRASTFTAPKDGPGGGTGAFLFGQTIAGTTAAGLDQELGTLIVTLDISDLLSAWSQQGDQLLITSPGGRVELASRPLWQGAEIETLIPAQTDGPGPRQQVIDGVEYLALSRPIGFRDWRMTYLAATGDLEDRVNSVLALEVTFFATLAALIFFVTARRAARESTRMRSESSNLRELNARLTREIEERSRVERSLQEAERSLEQSSKLAALGQMSAAVAHELNQPLAAMKTYIAGAQLLLRRNRTEEAVTSFQRVDDLITRMNALTQQLKSFSRKGGQELVQVDLRQVVTEALAIMAPQVGQQGVTITKLMPSDPIFVLGDPLRLEQIFINLMRNALDALRGHEAPVITIELFRGEALARVQVRDNGPGIEGDQLQLFEPFYTTKSAGDGVGLGLAISAQIARDLDGTLRGRNATEGGAVFELELPLSGGTT